MSSDLKLLLAMLAPVVLVVLVLFGMGRILAPADPSRKKRRPKPLEPWNHVTFSGGHDYASADERRAAEDDGPTAMGGGLLDAVRDEMNAHGFAVEPTCSEDWGWSAGVAVGEKEFLLCLGFVGDDPEQWLLTVDPVKPAVPPEEDPGFIRLVRGVDAALRSLEGISTVRWHAADTWESGKVDAWRERPSKERE